MSSRYHNHDEEIDYFIGTIVFKEDILEQIISKSKLKKLGECEIHVYPNEGPIPHFHLKNNDGFETCICIFSNRYFIHGKYRDTLTSAQLKQLDEWLSSNFDPISTNWYMIRSSWEILNEMYKNRSSYIKYKNIYKKPDYTTIVGYSE